MTSLIAALVTFAMLTPSLRAGAAEPPWRVLTARLHVIRLLLR
jgi:hypothetical protein